MPKPSYNLATLRTNLRPFRLHWFPRLRSTNDHAATLRKAGKLYAPAIVLTGHQTAGRGRGPNTWFSTAGCITVTFALPIEEHLAAHQIPLVAGLAVRNAAAELAAEPGIGLKWPNDIVHDGRKLAGLLCERLNRVDLIGLGFNLNLDPSQAPSSLRSRITSLQLISGRTFDPTQALMLIARHLLSALSRRSERPFAGLLQEYDRHHALLGRRVTVLGNGEQPTITGRCEGLDHIGRLLLRDRQHLHRVIAGHVEVL